MKLPFKKNKEVVFQKVKSPQGFTLENQDRKLTDFGDVDLEEYLEDLYVTPDQFLILTAPELQHQVRYIQACTHDGQVEVELGVEDEGTRLFYKMCTEEECTRIFLDFYDGYFVPDMKEYKPVEF
ncbi:MAG: hypothetical protein HFG62_12260 [Lachnospiraceae bacterium]|jgi:hypothetical protein|nr:hypothetical protein [Lachnospiraceae bacterium]